MKFTRGTALLALALLATSAGADTITWNGPVNGNFWDESNWLLNGGPGNPPVETVNNDITIVYDVIVTDGSSFTTHNNGSVKPNAGTVWTLTNSRVDLGDENPGAATRGQGGQATINLVNGSIYDLGWTDQTAFVVDGTSQLTFRNGNLNGIINSGGSVELAVGGSVWYKNAVWNATNITKDLDQFTVEGQAAVWGSDVTVQEPGDNIVATAGASGMVITAVGEAAAELKITSIAVSGTTATISMAGDDGVDCWCASSTDLSGFTTEETIHETGTANVIASPFHTSGGTLTFDVDVAGDTQLFLRVQDVDPEP